MIRLKNSKDIAELRISGRILSEVLLMLRDAVVPGINLEDLEELARREIKKRGAIPAFLGYRPDWSSEPYPAAICASINEEIVHAIPKDRTIKNGDVLKLDLGVSYNGYVTDAALTVLVEPVKQTARDLVSATRDALEAGITECIPKTRLGNIGEAVSGVAKERGFTVIKNLFGHGVGFAVHEEPAVLNWGKKNTGKVLEPGLVLAIEPMFSAGSDEIKEGLRNALVTADSSLAAHFEKTVLITSEGHEVLTPF